MAAYKFSTSDATELARKVEAFTELFGEPDTISIQGGNVYETMSSEDNIECWKTTLVVLEYDHFDTDLRVRRLFHAEENFGIALDGEVEFLIIRSIR